MEIGKKLKQARSDAEMTQEFVSEKIGVSRQTISNWENEKSYPDIVSIIKLSDLYEVSLDVLLKGDEKVMKHLEESTNIVSSNKKLIMAVILNILLIAVFMVTGAFFENQYLIVSIFVLSVIGSAILFYEIIKKF